MSSAGRARWPGPEEAVERLYAAIGDAPALRKAIGSVGTLVGAEVVAGQDYDHGRRVGCATNYHGFADEALRAYSDHYSHVNVWMLHGRHLVRPGGILLSHEMYPVEALDRTEFYSDWLRPLGLMHSMGAVVAVERDVTTTVAFLRGKAAGSYGPGEAGMLRRLVTHLGSVLRLHRRLARAHLEAESANTVLDCFPSAVVLVDAAGTVVGTNRAARELLAEADGLSLAGQALAVRGTEGADFRRLVSGAVGGGRDGQCAGSLRLSRASGRPALHVWVTRVPTHQDPFSSHGAVAAVFVTDPAASDPLSHERLHSLYGLTPAESRLASLLADGKELRQAAEALEVSLHTVRTQLRSLFAKTDTRRQAELVRLLLLSPARMR